MNLFIQAGFFLLDSLVGFFTFVLLLRFYMQAFRVSFRTQIGVFVMQLTNWLVIPLRKVLPGIFGLDLASLLPAYLLQVLLLIAFSSLRVGFDALLAGNAFGLILWSALLATLRISVYLLIGALFLLTILSWVNPFSPLAQSMQDLTRPFLAPIRRIVPPIANIDLSPLIAILLAQAILIFL